MTLSCDARRGYNGPDLTLECGTEILNKTEARLDLALQPIGQIRRRAIYGLECAEPSNPELLKRTNFSVLTSPQAAAKILRYGDTVHVARKVHTEGLLRKYGTADYSGGLALATDTITSIGGLTTVADVQQKAWSIPWHYDIPSVEE